MNNSTLRILSFNIRHGRGMDDQVNLQNTAAEIEISGSKLNFLCTHLGLDETEQTTQMDALIDVIKSTFGAMVLVGDFNMMPENLLVTKLSAAI